MKTIFLLIAFMLSPIINAQCITSFSTGDSHTLVIKNDGTLWSWGTNTSGELGLNSGAAFHDIPLKIGHETDWAKVFVQGNKSFVIKNGGTLWACGFGNSGGLGTGNNDDKLILTQIGTDTNWKHITSASGAGTIGMKTDGTLWGWGANIYGMLNLGNTSIEYNPVQISNETNWLKVVAGSHYSLAIKNNGTLWACGKNQNGQLGDGTTTNRLNFVQIGTDSDWLDIEVGYYNNSFAIKSNGTLWGWGANRIIIPFVSSSNFMFNTSLPDNLLIPTQISLSNNNTKIVAGNYTYAVLKSNGTIWISNFASGLIQTGNDTDWNFIDSGDAHLFFMKQNGSLWGKGANNVGQLGLGIAIQGVTVPTELNCSNFLGIEEINGVTKLSIYPNPTNGVLFIENNSDISIKKITLFDLSGKMLLENQINFSEIDMHKFETGIYILSIATENNIYRYKIVKK